MPEEALPSKSDVPPRSALATRLVLLALVGLFGAWLVVNGVLTIGTGHLSLHSVDSNNYERAVAEVVAGALFVVMDVTLIVFVVWIRPRVARPRSRSRSSEASGVDRDSTAR